MPPWPWSWRDVRCLFDRGTARRSILSEASRIDNASQHPARTSAVLSSSPSTNTIRACNTQRIEHSCTNAAEIAPLIKEVKWILIWYNVLRNELCPVNYFEYMSVIHPFYIDYFLHFWLYQSLFWWKLSGSVYMYYASSTTFVFFKLISYKDGHSGLWLTLSTSGTSALISIMKFHLLLKFVFLVSIHKQRWLPCLLMGLQIFWLLLCNCCLDFNETWQETSFKCLLPSVFFFVQEICFSELDVFMKHGCPRRQQNQNMAKSLSPTFWPHPIPWDMWCQWSVSNHEMSLQSKFSKCIITQTLNIALCKRDRIMDKQTDNLIQRCPLWTFQAGGIRIHHQRMQPLPLMGWRMLTAELISMKFDRKPSTWPSLDRFW